MTSFADRIRQQAKESAKPKGDGASGTLTDTILNQQAVTSTGKVQAPGPSGQSNIAERAAQGQAASQMDAVQAQTQQAAQQMGMAEQREEVKRKAAQAQKRVAEKQLATQRSDTIDQLMSQVAISENELESRKDQFNLEMLGQNLALQDKKYMSKVEEIGRRNRLDNKVNMQKEAARLEVGFQTEQFMNEMGFVVEEGAKARDWREKNMIEDLNTAEKYMQAKVQDQMRADKLSAGADVLKTGVTYAEDEGMFDSTTNYEDTDEFQGPPQG